MVGPTLSSSGFWDTPRSHACDQMSLYMASNGFDQLDGRIYVNSNILKMNLIFCMWVDYGGREWSFANFSKLWKTEKTNKYSLKAILS